MSSSYLIQFRQNDSLLARSIFRRVITRTFSHLTARQRQLLPCFAIIHSPSHVFFCLFLSTILSQLSFYSYLWPPSFRADFSFSWHSIGNVFHENCREIREAKKKGTQRASTDKFPWKARYHENDWQVERGEENDRYGDAERKRKTLHSSISHNNITDFRTLVNSIFRFSHFFFCNSSNRSLDYTLNKIWSIWLAKWAARISKM